MTTIDAPLGESMRAKFAELETRRRLHIDGLDQAVQAIADLRALDRHLVDAGLHRELQLEHLDTEDPPIEEPPEFRDDDLPAAVEPTPPPDPVEAAPVPASSGPGGPASRRRYTTEEKAEAVRLADELGSDSAAGKQLGMHGVSIGNWRRAGIGKQPTASSKKAASKKAASKEAEPKAAPAATSPTVKCKVCTEALPIVGEPSQVSRLAAHQAHWAAKPECGEAMRRRRA